jgi:hypothetical protein
MGSRRMARSAGRSLAATALSTAVTSTKVEIVGRDTVKQAGHEVRNNARANQAYAGSRGGQTEALP